MAKSSGKKIQPDNKRSLSTRAVHAGEPRRKYADSITTLITHPALVSYYDYTRKDRYKIGITDTLFRLAVGIEDVEDLIADLERGLGS